MFKEGQDKGDMQTNLLKLSIIGNFLSLYANQRRTKTTKSEVGLIFSRKISDYLCSLGSILNENYTENWNRIRLDFNNL